MEIEKDIPDISQLQEAGRIIRAGGVVIFPTETFYGIGADATLESALKRLFEIKGRDREKPVLVLVENPSWIKALAKEISPITTGLTQHFWPGGLTILFDAKPSLSPFLTGGKRKIGIRCSSHPVATALVKEVGRPITATSANLSGKPPPSSPQEISQELMDRVDFVLDAGKTPGGLPSTVIDTTVQPPKIIRDGIISREDIVAMGLSIH